MNPYSPSGNLETLSHIKANQEKYEREKKERNDRFLKLQQERQRILDERERILHRLHEDKTIQFPLSRLSNISTGAAVDIAREKIPVFQKIVQDNAASNEVKKRMLAHPYRGELGIRSYQPWQLKDFYFVRDFVQCWVDEVLNYIIIDPVNDYNGATAAEDLQRQLSIEQHELEVSASVKEVHSEIISEACSELISDIVEEILTINFQSEQVITNMILGAVMNDKTDENTAILITNTYNQMKKERSRHPNLWCHSQKFDYLGNDTLLATDKEEDTFDGKVLSFDGIDIISNIPNQGLNQDFKHYRLLESKYWSGNNAVSSTVPIPRRYKGFTCAALSSDHSLVAIGTLQGDIAVWNLMEYPPRILKGCKGNSGILQIQWSLNSMLIVTITQHGNIQLWSVGKPGGLVDIKAFEPVSNDGFESTQLINEVTLEPKDLLFTQGNLASAKSTIEKPTVVVFHPTFTFLGQQECLVVGLTNGNILKLNLGDKTSFSLAQKVKHNGDVNQIGKGIEAELFKAHKHPIKLIAFVDNVSQMLSVDEEGFLYLWDYTEDNLSGYGWFIPSSSYRLDMTQKTYKPATDSHEKIEFTDVVKGSGRVKELNRQDMIAKRKEMQTLINSLHLGKPWKTSSAGSQKVNYLYAPRNVPESGATFHSVTYYRENRLLAHYSTQLYQPITINATKLMTCKMNPLGNQIVMSLLFDEVPPKSPHVLFVTIDVTSMKIATNLVEVALSPADYKQCEVNDCCDFDISRKIDATGSQYMFTNVCGTVGGFSMITTNLVMASSEQGWIGCSLGDEVSTIFSTAKVLVASQELGLCMVLFAPKINTVNFLHIRDNNTTDIRKKVWQAYNVYMNPEEGIHPRECLRKHQWTLDGETTCHLQCTMETLVLDIIDKAVEQCAGSNDTESSKNRILPYLRHNGQQLNDENSSLHSYGSQSYNR